MNADSTKSVVASTSRDESSLLLDDTAHVSGPDYRAHVTRNNDALPPEALYDLNSLVYLKKARGLDGPFTITKVNSDKTYQLATEDGKFFRDGVRERDLQPL